MNWRDGGSKLVDKLMNYVSYHKTGTRGEPWKHTLNAVNLSKYLEVYLK